MAAIASGIQGLLDRLTADGPPRAWAGGRSRLPG
jgi:hypothetical protein